MNKMVDTLNQTITEIWSMYPPEYGETVAHVNGALASIRNISLTASSEEETDRLNKAAVTCWTRPVHL